MHPSKFSILFVLLFSSFAWADAPAWQKDFESYLDSVVKEFGLPGIAVEVVDVNGVVMQVTRGYRDVEAKKPVTPQTLYAIGSTSKAFTGVMLAQMRDQGLVDFEQPVRKYWPGFALSDSTASAEVTLHDLASHYTGVGRHDLAWAGREGLTRAEALSLVPRLPMSAKPRTQFLYNNWMLLVLGHIEEILTGSTWEELVRDRVFRPLGMLDTNTSLADTQRSANYAFPYRVDETLKATRIPFLDIGVFNPAGGIYSNLDDMAKWVRMHLNEGRAGNQVVVSKESLAETYKDYTPMAPAVSYAMGWIRVTKDGMTTLTHDGGVNGFRANVSIVAERKMGVVVLMNETSVTPEWIAARLWQHIRGQELKDIVRIGAAAAKNATAEQAKRFPDPAIHARPELADFAGSYCSDVYGKVEVTRIGEDRLHIKLNMVDFELKPAGETRFFVPGMWAKTKFVDFQKTGARAEGLTWALEESSQDLVSFKRCD